jgi:hypothetical protein
LFLLILQDQSRVVLLLTDSLVLALEEAEAKFVPHGEVLAKHFILFIVTQDFYGNEKEGTYAS